MKKILSWSLLFAATFYADFNLLRAASGPRMVVLNDRTAPAEKTANWLRQALQSHGGKVETLSSLDAGNLEQADLVLLQSAEFKPLAGAERQALEHFTRRGGALIALHGGIASGESGWLKPLLGGAWTAESRRLTNRMTLYVAANQHPIVQGASSFDLDDQTIYDLDLDPAVKVLASAFTPKMSASGSRRPNRNAAESAGREQKASIFDLQPQLWTYEAPAREGAKSHRAFVALQGSTATVDHSSYRVFLLRAIAWTTGRENLDAFCSREDVANLMYPVGGPRRAQDTVKQMEVHPGFKVNVVASEPLINKPIAVQWDERGRLWVAETPEYPNGRRPTVAEPWKEGGSLAPGKYDRPATDRISILSAPDAQGQFQKKTVFYDGLELVTGFCFYRDGIIVLHEPDILWIRDTDQDGKGDKVERLYTGFRMGDTHFIGNHFIPGPDGWIYASMGGGAEVKRPDNNQVVGRVTSGMFRFKPDGTAVEQISSKGGNGFGADVTSDFELFFGQATTGNPIQHVVVPEQILAKGTVGAQGGAKSVIERRKIVLPQMPDRAALVQIDVVGGFSAACASLCYEGGAWPEEWNRNLFCTEPILNIIHHERLKTTGATFTAEKTRDPEFIHSRDYWFRPIDVAPGPDGAIYLLDFYTPVIAHNDTRGPQHSRSGASVRPDRDHYFGRIYRVQHDQAKQWTVPDLSKARPAEVAKSLSHPNRNIRFTAQRLLVEKGGAEVIQVLEPLAASSSFSPARILSLWALSRLNALKPAVLQSALQAKEPEIRKNGALIVAATGGQGVERYLTAGLTDTDARVRLATLRAMAAGALTDESATALVKIFPTLEDDWSKSAAVAAASGNPVASLSAALKAANPDGLRSFVTAVTGPLGDKQNGQAFADLLPVVAAAPEAADPLKGLILQTAAKIKQPPAGSSSQTEALRKLLTSSNPEVSAAALPLALNWVPADGLKGEVNSRITSWLSRVASKEVDDSQRAALAAGLIGARQSNPQVLPAVEKLLSGDESDALKRRLITALGQTADPEIGPVLVRSFKQMSTPAQNAAFDVLHSRKEWTLSFLGALEKQEVAISSLGAPSLFRLRTHPAREVSSRAEALLKSLNKGTPDKDALIAQFAPVVSQPGNAAKGKELFTVNCAICHRFGEIGQDVGPVLTGMGIHGTESMLIHILDPNRRVDGGYETWNIETTDGEVQSGIVVQENPSRVVLQMANQRLEIPTAKIKSRVDTRRSMMPEGFEALGQEGLRDMMTFLVGDAGRFRVLDLSGAFTADTRRGLYASAEALEDTLPFRRFGVVPVEGVPFYIVNPSNSPLGGNVIVLKGGGRDDFAFGLPQRVEVPVGFAAAKFHFLGGVAGWGGSARDDGPVAMRVTMLFSDGDKHEVALRQGDVFVDYIGQIDAPSSKLAEGVVRGKQVRWFTLPVPRKSLVTKLILESAGSGPAPTTVAITADLSPTPLPGEPVVQLASLRPMVGAAAPVQATKPVDTAVSLTWEPGLKVLVVGGGSSHDFKKWFNTADVAVLRGAKFSVNYTESSATATKALADADVLVSSTNQRDFDTPGFREALLKFVEGGKGVVLLHPAIWYNWPWTDYNKLLVGGGSRGHDAIAEFDVKMLKEHPVTEGLPRSFKAVDELYYVNFDPAGTPVEVLAETSTAKATKKEHASIWVVKHPKTKIVAIAIGHDGRVHELPEYQKLLVNAVKWVSQKN